MPNGQIEIAIPYWADRHLPPKLIGEFARGLEASGVVDYLQTWDQMTSWWPRSLWTTKNTPLAAHMPDCDSFQDAFIAAAYGSAPTENLGLLVSTDTIRRGPAELMQTMLTLSAAVDGHAIFAFGAGEAKQVQPYGWKRSEGLARMEDMLQLFERIWESEGTIDFEGRHWNFKDAWIGNAKPFKPVVHGLGGGPKLRELSARYTDGFQSSTFAYDTAEKFATDVEEMRGQIEGYDRDPDAFTFGMWDQLILVRDDDEHERALHNPLMKFMAATIGYLGDQADWRNFGFEPVMPSGWHYAMKMLPARMSPAETEDIVNRTDPGMVEKCCFIGTPEQVAPRIQEYVDAGATLHSFVDVSPALRSAEEASVGVELILELARLVKAQAPALSGT